MQNNCSNGIGRNISNLVELFGEFCITIFTNQNSVRQKKIDVDYAAMHKSISSLIKFTLENEELSFGEDLKDVVYVIAALADEIFLNMDWEGKQYWEENMLEYRYFGTQIAGDEIFKKINRLLLENEALSREKAEIYLEALALGFMGKYRGLADEQSEFNAHRNRLFEFLQKSDKSMFLIGHRLFQKEYTHTIPTIHRKLLPDASIINYISAFFIFMFLVISSVVWIFETKDIRRLLTEISTIALRE
ncbi:MAG: DotU family type IV/VI secretion system protein [Holosporaceae bacterium]|nr:DotU family type IV/VI secretion system protein [Holosporaceae bacterium]